MRAKTMAITGVAIIAILMILTAASIKLYIDDSSSGMLAMSACSTGMMLFAMIFAVVYLNKTESASARYENMYRRCPECGGTVNNGICEKCNKKI